MDGLNKKTGRPRGMKVNGPKEGLHRCWWPRVWSKVDGPKRWKWTSLKLRQTVRSFGPTRTVFWAKVDGHQIPNTNTYFSLKCRTRTKTNTFLLWNIEHEQTRTLVYFYPWVGSLWWGIGFLEISPKLILWSFPGNFDPKRILVLSVLVHHEPIT